MTEPTLSEDNKVAVFTVISKSEPWADETVSLVENLRDEVIPGGARRDEGELLRRRPDGRLHRPRQPDRRQAAADDRGRRPAQLPRPADGLPLGAGADQGGGDEPDLGRRLLRRRHRGLPARLGLVADRARPPDTDRQLRALVDVRDPLRALDGLRGVPDDADERALRRVRRRAPGGGRRARQHRPRDHLGGGDHGLRLRQLRPQRRPGGEGVRGRAGGRDRDRLDRRPLPAGAGGDGADGQVGLVDAEVARPDRAAASASRARSSSRRATRAARGRRTAAATARGGRALRQTEGRCSRSTCPTR